MGSVYKTDIDGIAVSYLKSRIDGVGAYSSGRTPQYTNTGGVSSYPSNPPAARPSQYLSGDTKAVPIRDLMIQLATAYSNIGVGMYGLHSSDSNTGANWVQGAGSGYFVLSGFNNGVGGGLGGVNPPAGPLTQQQVIDLYQYGWNVLSSCIGREAVDLTVCHSSCHTSCHGSRGRR